MSSFLLSVPLHISATPLAFEFWRNEAPQIIREHIQQFTKPGANGHGERKLGRWGVPFTCQLESHHTSYAIALAQLPTFTRCIGAGIIQVVYNDVAFADLGVGFTVQDVSLESDSHSRVWQLGPGYSYQNAGILRTKWQMTPVDITIKTI